MDSADLTLVKKREGRDSRVQAIGEAQKIAKWWRVSGERKAIGTHSFERTNRLGIILLPFTFHTSLKVNEKEMCLLSRQC